MDGFSIDVCAAAELRTSEERARLSAELRANINTMLVQLYDADQINFRPDFFADFFAGVLEGTCYPNSSLIAAFRNDPVGLQAFDTRSGRPSWVERPQVDLDRLRQIGAAGRRVNMRNFSLLSPENFASALAESGISDSDFGRALALNHRAVTYAYVDNVPPVYANGAQVRKFLSQPAEGNGQVVLAGRLDMRPILAGGKLRVGLRLNMVYDDKGGLAAQISGRDQLISEALDNAARSVIREVRLMRGAEVFELNLEQTTAGGTHVFAADIGSDDISGLVLDVDLALFGHEWNMRFPLYIGDFAFRQRTGL